MRRRHARIRILQADSGLAPLAFSAPADRFLERIALSLLGGKLHLFRFDASQDENPRSAGAPAAAAAVGSAPLPNADAPAQWSMEQTDAYTESLGSP